MVSRVQELELTQLRKAAKVSPQWQQHGLLGGCRCDGVLCESMYVYVYCAVWEVNCKYWDE